MVKRKTQTTEKGANVTDTATATIDFGSLLEDLTDESVAQAVLNKANKVPAARKPDWAEPMLRDFIASGKQIQVVPLARLNEALSNASTNGDFKELDAAGALSILNRIHKSRNLPAKAMREGDQVFLVQTERPKPDQGDITPGKRGRKPKGENVPAEAAEE